MSSVSRFVSRLWLLAHPERRGTLPILISNEGFWFRPISQGDRVFVRWAEIREVFAMRIDAVIITDLIYLGIRFDASGRFIQISELHPEFDRLASAIEAHMPLPSGWKQGLLDQEVQSRIALYGVRSQQTYSPIF